MNIDSCFILAAGLGKRMGPIGQVLPKPMWPLFETSLIGWIKSLLTPLGIKNFYANVCGLKDLLIPHLESLGISPVLEKNLLGTGGAFYHFRSQHPQIEKLLAINSDQLIQMGPGLFEGLKALSERKHSHALLAHPVSRGQTYGRLVIKDGLLRGIDRAPGEDGLTYSGLAIVDMRKLEKTKGPQPLHFFESVADFQKHDIPILIQEKIIPLDFGSFEHYYRSCFRVLTEKNLQWALDWGIQQKMILAHKLNVENTSYFSSTRGLLNFGSLALWGPSSHSPKGPGLYYKNLHIPCLFLKKMPC